MVWRWESQSHSYLYPQRARMGSQAGAWRRGRVEEGSWGHTSRRAERVPLGLVGGTSSTPRLGGQAGPGVDGGWGFSADGQGVRGRRVCSGSVWQQREAESVHLPIRWQSWGSQASEGRPGCAKGGRAGRCGEEALGPKDLAPPPAPQHFSIASMLSWGPLIPKSMVWICCLLEGTVYIGLFPAESHACADSVLMNKGRPVSPWRCSGQGGSTGRFEDRLNRPLGRPWGERWPRKQGGLVARAEALPKPGLGVTCWLRDAPQPRRTFALWPGAPVRGPHGPGRHAEVSGTVPSMGTWTAGHRAVRPSRSLSFPKVLLQGPTRRSGRAGGLRGLEKELSPSGEHINPKGRSQKSPWGPGPQASYLLPLALGGASGPLTQV